MRGNNEYELKNEKKKRDKNMGKRETKSFIGGAHTHTHT